MYQRLIEKSHILVESVSLEFVRDKYHEIDFTQRLIGIVGQRGIGKTTLMLQYLKNLSSKKSIYFSADDIGIANSKIYYLVEELFFQYNITVFCIDEIHKYHNWNQELKNIYDSFPSVQVIFSGSSSIDLIKGKYDLSRRLTLYPLAGFSFREYLNKVTQKNLEKISLGQLLEHHQSLSQDISHIFGNELLSYFREYTQKGYYPFVFESTNEEVFYGKLFGALDKLVYEDIANFYNIESQNLEKIKKIILFYAFATPGELSINALKNKLSLAYDTVVHYLDILQEVGVLRGIYAHGVISKSLRKAKKVLLDNTNLVYCINKEVGFQVEKGTIREIFFVNQFPKGLFFSDEGGDFVVLEGNNKYTFEVGGKNKKQKQIQNLTGGFVVQDERILGIGNSIPLWMFGFLR